MADDQSVNNMKDGVTKSNKDSVEPMESSVDMEKKVDLIEDVTKEKLETDKQDNVQNGCQANCDDSSKPSDSVASNAEGMNVAEPQCDKDMTGQQCDKDMAGQQCDKEASESGVKCSEESLNTEGEKEMIDFKLVYSKQTYNISFPIDCTVRSLKDHVEQLTDVEVANQKMMFKGLMKDELTLRDLKMTSGAKVMLVGSKKTDIQAITQTAAAVKDTGKATSAASGKEPLCKQKPHKTVLDKYGKPDDVMPGIKNSKESLPAVPLFGMYNKTGGKVRLTFKLEADQLWLGTKERTEKLGLTSIKAVVSEPIEGHEEYHIMGLQLGPTEASRYWIYWVPAQYIDSIKDTILGNWQYF